jgi:hypothetical protein
MHGGETPSPTRAPRWRELGLLGKLGRVAAFAFFVTFSALGIAKSLPKDHWLSERVAPLEQKVWRLRLGSNWRMFVGEARFGDVALETVVDGDRYQLENFRWEGKSWWERAKDMRLRKLQANLKFVNHRKRWGRYYFAYVCRTAGRDLPGIATIELIRTRPLILDETGKRRSRPRRELIGTYECATGRFTEVQ